MNMTSFNSPCVLCGFCIIYEAEAKYTSSTQISYIHSYGIGWLVSVTFNQQSAAYWGESISTNIINSVRDILGDEVRNSDFIIKSNITETPNHLLRQFWYCVFAPVFLKFYSGVCTNWLRRKPAKACVDGGNSHIRFICRMKYTANHALQYFNLIDKWKMAVFTLLYLYVLTFGYFPPMRLLVMHRSPLFLPKLILFNFFSQFFLLFCFHFRRLRGSDSRHLRWLAC